MSKKIKVRFNLGAGKNYMKWKVTDKDGNNVYYDPEQVQLVMEGCVFKNNKKIAQKIFDGSHKMVCSWISCDNIKIMSEISDIDTTRQVKYNPRIQPNWVLDGNIIDDCEYSLLSTHNKNVYIID